MKIYRTFAQLFLFLVSLSYLWICPHSKVEESFSLQAVHDLFYHGVSPILTLSSGQENGDTEIPPYDHLQYPGVVPRSFTGPLFLAVACQIIRLIFYPFYDIAESPMDVQFMARFILLSAFVHGWFRLAASVDGRVGGTRTGTWLLLLTACQFHMPFYASRMLPNIFATTLCLHAFSAWIADRIPEAAVLVIMTTAIFRCDVILLLFTAGLSWICVQRKLGILQSIRLGVFTGVASLVCTVPLDSALWQRPVWPEGEVLFFNTILNKSSEWGVSAWYFYFSSSLPKAMVLTLPMVPLAILQVPEKLATVENILVRQTQLRPDIPHVNLLDTKWMPILLPAFGYVVLYSFLGHKETRFLFPVLPVFNLAAAIGLDRVFLVAFPQKEKRPSMLGRLAFLICLVSLVLTLVSSWCFVAVSHSNYPGGDALSALSQRLDSVTKSENTTARVYVDVASAMSGVSLFGQRAAFNTGKKHGIHVEFEKAGYEEDNAQTPGSSFQLFTHLLTEDETVVSDKSFHTVFSMPGHPWIDWRNGRIRTSESIFVLERVDWFQ